MGNRLWRDELADFAAPSGCPDPVRVDQHDEEIRKAKQALCRRRLVGAKLVLEPPYAEANADRVDIDRDSFEIRAALDQRTSAVLVSGVFAEEIDPKVRHRASRAASWRP